jgi:hypothetical protein
MPARNSSDPLANLVWFDHDLHLGQEVEVRWTSSGIQHAARARVVKLNAKSLRAELLEEAPSSFGGPYPVGHVISVPRWLNRDYSLTNGAALPRQYNRGDIIEGRGKVVSIYFTIIGHEYRCEGEKEPTPVIPYDRVQVNT